MEETQTINERLVAAGFTDSPRGWLRAEGRAPVTTQDAIESLPVMPLLIELQNLHGNFEVVAASYKSAGRKFEQTVQDLEDQNRDLTATVDAQRATIADLTNARALDGDLRDRLAQHFPALAGHIETSDALRNQVEASGAAHGFSTPRHPACAACPVGLTSVVGPQLVGSTRIEALEAAVADLTESSDDDANSLAKHTSRLTDLESRLDAVSDRSLDVLTPVDELSKRVGGLSDSARLRANAVDAKIAEIETAIERIHLRRDDAERRLDAVETDVGGMLKTGD